MTFIERARKLRKIIEQAMTSVDDKTASEAVELFPTMKYDNSLIKAGTRINWNNVVKRAAVDLYNTELNNPDNAPTLWEDIAYRDGYRIIPENITPGMAFALDELGWWNDVLYKSTMDNNVFNPDQYSDGWVLYGVQDNTPDTPIDDPNTENGSDENNEITGDITEPNPDVPDDSGETGEVPTDPTDDPNNENSSGENNETTDEPTGDTTEPNPDVPDGGSDEPTDTESEDIPVGAYENPIPAEVGMEYTEGLHYTYNGIVYRCTRTSVLYYTPDALVGHYFEIV